MGLPDFSTKRVLCIGDLMLDFFVRGSATRLSPEAPVAIMRPTENSPLLGGVANVACNVVSLGGHASLVSVVGQDQAADRVEGLLESFAPSLTFQLIREASRQTTQKIRFISGTHHLLRVDHEDHHPLSATLEDQVWEAVAQDLIHADLVLLSDYGKGVLTDSLILKIIHTSRTLGKRVLIDPKGRAYKRYEGAHILTPNLHELQEATGLTLQGNADVEKAGRILAELVQCDAIVVTRGKDGVSIVTPSGDVRHFPTQAREVFDVSGAGDTLVATLALALAAQMPLEDAVTVANYAAGIAVSKVGTATVSLGELTASMTTPDPCQKIKSLDQMTSFRDLWRSRGERVAFTNGCFDLLHPGHLKTFFEARQRCDRLIVGLNTDRSVAQLKGPSRPLQSQDLRARVLASLPTVDGVVLFDTPTPQHLIQALCPDLLVKGGDYKIEDLGDAPFVQSYGGEVLLVPLLPDHSTSLFINTFLAV